MLHFGGEKMELAVVEIQNRQIDIITTKIISLQKSTTKNCIEIGSLLIKAKEVLPHGEWLNWLKNKVDFTERTAQRFMAVAKEFPNTTTLSFSKLLLLLEIPNDKRNEFIDKLHVVSSGESKKIDRMTIKEMRSAVKTYKCQPIYFNNSEFVNISENVIQFAKSLSKYVVVNKVAIEPEEKSNICLRLQQVIKELKAVDNSLSGRDSKKYYSFSAN